MIRRIKNKLFKKRDNYFPEPQYVYDSNNNLVWTIPVADSKNRNRIYVPAYGRYADIIKMDFKGLMKKVFFNEEMTEIHRIRIDEGFKPYKINDESN